MEVREVAAGVMSVLFGIVGVFWLIIVIRSGFAAPPQSSAVAATTLLVTGIVVLEIALAIMFPKKSGEPPDERERLIVARAGNMAGWALLLGVLLALGHYVNHGNGNVMFHVITLAFIVSGLVDYVAQILLFRR